MTYTTDQAYQAGRWAREANRPPSSCPMYGMCNDFTINFILHVVSFPMYAMGNEGMKLREAWRKGWAEADREMRDARR